MEIFKPYLESALFKNLQSEGAEVFFVGGCVRDYFLNKQPKDVDIVVRNFQPDKLTDVAKRTGSISLVGEAFGTFLYKDKSGFKLEIALPRSDAKGAGKGHKAIDAQSDPFMPIEQDLKRRDFTINAIALDTNLRIIDPFFGLKDLYRGVVRCVDEQAFPDDPLRILRAIRFAICLNFQFAHEMYRLIVDHKEELQHIPAERKLMELDKIIEANVYTPDVLIAINATDTSKEIFGCHFTRLNDIVKLSHMADLLHLIPFEGNKVKHFTKHLKINKDTQHLLRAMEHFESTSPDDVVSERIAAFKTLSIAKKHELVYASPIFAECKVFQEFKEGKYPTHVHKIKFTGGDIEEAGFENEQITKVQNHLLNLILSDELPNDKYTLEKYVWDNQFALQNLK